MTQWHNVTNVWIRNVWIRGFVGIVVEAKLSSMLALVVAILRLNFEVVPSLVQ